MLLMNIPLPPPQSEAGAAFQSVHVRVNKHSRINEIKPADSLLPYGRH